MYGLVNKAIQDVVVREYGKGAWTAVLEAAGTPEVDFQGMEEYPDHLTYALVGATAKTLNMSTDQVLEILGEYWVLYTAKAGYGDLLQMAGDSFVGLLQNLDLLHARIGRSYPALQPPAFQCTDISESSLLLHYRSGRAGLAPLVVGLIRGVAKMFKVTAAITVLDSKSAGADHDIFRISYASDTH